MENKTNLEVTVTNEVLILLGHNTDFVGGHGIYNKLKIPNYNVKLMESSSKLYEAYSSGLQQNRIPCLVVFAGKTHPNKALDQLLDIPTKPLLKRIYHEKGGLKKLVSSIYQNL